MQEDIDGIENERVSLEFQLNKQLSKVMNVWVDKSEFNQYDATNITYIQMLLVQNPSDLFCPFFPIIKRLH